MNPRLRALRALVTLRERREQALQEALTAARRQLDRARREAAAAQAQAGRCDDALREAEAALQSLRQDTFTPMAQRAMALRNDGLRGEAARAAQVAAAAAARLPPLEQAVRAAQRELLRNDQRIDYFRQRIGELLQAQERERAEGEDEEAGESAVVRLLAAGRIRATEDAA